MSIEDYIIKVYFGEINIDNEIDCYDCEDHVYSPSHTFSGFRDFCLFVVEHASDDYDISEDFCLDDFLRRKKLL